MHAVCLLDIYVDSSGMSVVDDTQGHVGAVCSVDSHEYLNIFLSTG